MHELGILDAMIHTIEDVVREEGAEEVERIVLDVGELSGVVPRYLEECWPAARYKTSMEETELEVCVVPGIVSAGTAAESSTPWSTTCAVQCVRGSRWRSFQEMT